MRNEPMSNPSAPRFRTAEPADAEAVAALHTDSWQRHYRVAFTDAYLDREVPEQQLRRWSKRLAAPDPRARTILAELDGEVVGFAHTVLGDDPTWGALLDNLHVQYGLKRHGIGTRLMALTARTVLAETPESGLYLWVLEQNTGARAFYTARGGECVGRDAVEPPHGDVAKLKGKPFGLRFAWRDPSVLVAEPPA
jgi:ribosomal protein S18 acetylase RimI-like enzyme